MHKDIITIKELEQRADIVGISRINLYKYLEKLVSLGVGKFTNEKIFIDKPYFDFKGDIAKKGAVDLQRIFVRTTSECSLNCIFCDRRKPKICFPCSRFLSHSTKPIETKELKQALYEAHLFNSKEIMFTGGDPFTSRASFLKILFYACEYFENVEVFSNLSHLTVEQKKALKELDEKVKVIFPIFGEEDTHDLISGGKGYFKQTIKNAIDLINKGIKIRALALKIKNKDHKNILNLLKNENIPFHLFSPIPLGKDGNISEFFDGSSIEPQGFDKVDIYNFFYRKSFNQCWGQQIFIDYNGEVRLCLFTNKVLGEIPKDSLRDILREGRQDEHWNLTKDKIYICKDCEFRYCCPLDCRVVSEVYHGSSNSKYPFCDYDPHEGKWRIANENKGGT